MTPRSSGAAASLTFLYLAAALPTNELLITAAVVVESFSLTFGCVGLSLVMMQEIAPGQYLTAHYAFASATMMSTRVLFGGISGAIQTVRDVLPLDASSRLRSTRRWPRRWRAAW